MSIAPLNISAAGDSGSYTPVQQTSSKPDPVVSTTPPVATAQEKRSSESEVSNAVDKLNSFAAQNASDLIFSKDQDTGKMLIKLVDTATNTVIRQIPTQEAIEIAKSIDKLQGLLINHKA